jgi:diadenosine tetraphosphate (Ap4A) HIT family hydrolase
VSDCLICDQLASVDGLPGGALIDDDLVVGYHLPPIDRFPRQYLGRVLLVTRRHVDHLGDLTADEAMAVGRGARIVAAAMRNLDEVTRVHVAVIGLHVPHFHMHLIARYDWVPPDADWNRLHEHPKARLGGDVEIRAFVERLRPHLVPTLT